MPSHRDVRPLFGGWGRKLDPYMSGVSRLGLRDGGDGRDGRDYDRDGLPEGPNDRGRQADDATGTEPCRRETPQTLTAASTRPFCTSSTIRSGDIGLAKRKP